MVYQGPSRGCATCRKRRIKCDEGRPGCNACLKRKQACPGYRDAFDLVLKDQSVSVPQKARRKEAAQERRRAREKEYLEDESGSCNVSPRKACASTDTRVAPESDSSLLAVRSIPPNAEMTSLCFFFTNYVGLSRDSSISRGFFEYLLPVYSHVSYDSPLSLATSAVAVNLSSMWMQKGPDTLLARSVFSRALSATKAAIMDPAQSMTDETLLTVLLLEFYESVGSRFNNKDSSGTHSSGAVALIRHRGASNFKDETSKRLLLAVRNQMVTQALQKKQEIDFDPQVWEDQADMPVNSATQLDRLVAELANLQVMESGMAAAPSEPTTPDSSSSATSDASISLINAVFSTAIDLDARLSLWKDTVPPTWHPVSVTSPEHVHPSIFDAGVYGESCHVYYSLHVAAIFNQWRCTRLAVLKIILKCCDAIGSDFMDGFTTTKDYARHEVQQLVDDVCASAPYYLGNRTEPGMIDDTCGVEYPQMPIIRDKKSSYPPDMLSSALERKRQDHARLAAALGGHFLLSTLIAVLRCVQVPSSAAWSGPSLLRRGQLQWIVAQLDRLRRIYLIPKPNRALPSPEGGFGSYDVTDTQDVEVVPQTYAGNQALFEDEAWMTAIRGKHPSRPLCRM